MDEWVRALGATDRNLQVLARLLSDLGELPNDVREALDLVATANAALLAGSLE